MHLDFYEFAADWHKEDVNPLVRYPTADAMPIPDKSREFFRDVGLPSSAAPFLNFGDEDAQLVPVAEAWDIDGTEYQELFVIGETGDGDPICVRAGDGAILALSHDYDFAVTFVNTSVVHLVYFLLKYRTFMKGVPDRASVDQLEQAFLRIDAPALGKGAFWRTVLEWDASPAASSGAE